MADVQTYRQKLYKNLSNEYDLPDYNVWEQSLSDPKYQEKAYSFISNEYDVKKDDFLKSLGIGQRSKFEQPMSEVRVEEKSDVFQIPKEVDPRTLIGVASLSTAKAPTTEEKYRAIPQTSVTDETPQQKLSREQAYQFANELGLDASFKPIAEMTVINPAKNVISGLKRIAGSTATGEIPSLTNPITDPLEATIGGVQTAFGVQMAVPTPINLAFNVGMELASHIAPDAVETVFHSVTKSIKPTSKIGKQISELGDIGVSIALLHGLNKYLPAGKRYIADKMKRGEELTPQETEVVEQITEENALLPEKSEGVVITESGLPKIEAGQVEQPVSEMGVKGAEKVFKPEELPQQIKQFANEEQAKAYAKEINGGYTDNGGSFIVGKIEDLTNLYKKPKETPKADVVKTELPPEVLAEGTKELPPLEVKGQENKINIGETVEYAGQQYEVAGFKKSRKGTDQIVLKDKPLGEKDIRDIAINNIRSRNPELLNDVFEAEFNKELAKQIREVKETLEMSGGRTIATEIGDVKKLPSKDRIVEPTAEVKTEAVSEAPKIELPKSFKRDMIAALNKAGEKVEGLSDESLIAKYRERGLDKPSVNESPESGFNVRGEANIEQLQRFDELQKSKSDKELQEDFARRSEIENERRRLLQQAENKKFEERAQSDEASVPIEQRIDAKIADRRPLTPEEQKYFEENQYAPKGFKYDNEGNLVKVKAEKLVKESSGLTQKQLDDINSQTNDVKRAEIVQYYLKQNRKVDTTEPIDWSKPIGEGEVVKRGIAKEQPPAEVSAGKESIKPEDYKELESIPDKKYLSEDAGERFIDEYGVEYNFVGKNSKGSRFIYEPTITPELEPKIRDVKQRKILKQNNEFVNSLEEILPYATPKVKKEIEHFNSLAKNNNKFEFGETRPYKLWYRAARNYVETFAKNIGGKKIYESEKDGTGSVYYGFEDGTTLRLTDHDLPIIGEREFKTQGGMKPYGNWNYEIVLDRIYSKSELDKIISDNFGEKEKFQSSPSKEAGTEKQPQILKNKATGSQFSGSTWGEFTDRITDYFLPKFNKPITLEKRSDVLMDNFTSKYGKEDIQKLIKDYDENGGQISITTSDKGRNFKTTLPDEVAKYFVDKMRESVPDLKGKKEGGEGSLYSVSPTMLKDMANESIRPIFQKVSDVLKRSIGILPDGVKRLLRKPFSEIPELEKAREDFIAEVGGDRVTTNKLTRILLDKKAEVEDYMTLDAVLRGNPSMLKNTPFFLQNKWKEGYDLLHQKMQELTSQLSAIGVDVKNEWVDGASHWYPQFWAKHKGSMVAGRLFSQPKYRPASVGKSEIGHTQARKMSITSELDPEGFYSVLDKNGDLIKQEDGSLGRFKTEKEALDYIDKNSGYKLSYIDNTLRKKVEEIFPTWKERDNVIRQLEEQGVRNIRTSEQALSLVSPMTLEHALGQGLLTDPIINVRAGIRQASGLARKAKFLDKVGQYAVTGEAPQGWVKVEDYGLKIPERLSQVNSNIYKLKNGYLPKSIAEDLAAFYGTKQRTLPAVLGQMLEKGLRLGRTALYPFRHIRQIPENELFLFFADSGLFANKPYQAKAFKEAYDGYWSYKTTPIYEQFLKLGGEQEGFIPQEFQRYAIDFSKFRDIEGSNAPLSLVEKIDAHLEKSKLYNSMENKIEFAKKVYHFEDMVYKFYAFKGLVEKRGKTPEEAMNIVKDSFFYGREAPELVNILNRYIPFAPRVLYEFTRVAGNHLKRKPASFALKAGLLAAAYDELRDKGLESAGFTEDEMKKMGDAAPKWYEAILPMTDEKGKPIKLNMQWLLPYSDLWMWDIENQQQLSQVAQRMMPMRYKPLVSTLMGKTSYGTDIAEKGDPDWKQKYAENLVFQYTPGMFGEYWKRLYDNQTNPDKTKQKPLLQKALIEPIIGNTQNLSKRDYVVRGQMPLIEQLRFLEDEKTKIQSKYELSKNMRLIKEHNAKAREMVKKISQESGIPLTADVLDRYTIRPSEARKKARASEKSRRRNTPIQKRFQ